MVRLFGPEFDGTRLVVLQKTKDPLEPVQVTNSRFASESTHGHYSTHDIKPAQGDCPLQHAKKLPIEVHPTIIKEI